ncbi:MAG: non-reducing end alpha-L-arabinofuranosidase family hydrolase, partial [Bacillota bacterium]
EGYYCAPQVFYFQPQKKWYLIYQAVDKSQTPEYFGPAYSTSENVANPDSWSKTAFMKVPKPQNGRWIDFWVICDDAKAYLFFTSLDGRMWRAETKLADFPHGWNEPTLCLQGDIFEASHTYKLKGVEQYLTLVEAQDSGRRYYKAYLAESLGGEWRELAATRKKPFASRANVKQPGSPWTDSISHGELLRSGYDEKLEVDPHHLRLLFQGVSDKAKAGKDYGQIPWKLGILDLQN